MVIKSLTGVCAALVLLLIFNHDAHNSTKEKLHDLQARNKLLAEMHKKTQAAYDDVIKKTVTEYDKQIQNQKALISKRDADIASGIKRLSIATSSCGVPSNRDTGAPTTKNRAELEPAAARRIVRITDDGDEAIIKCNALIDIVRKTVLK